ncbi:MAG: hypothetical protein KDC45_15050, partial [Bacteroidetes bacterium]|nr:hypothetical protein [Bacteroidota bacterium]
MEITFYGVRGTVAIPGESTNEFGGNTSCVHVKTAKGYDIVLDAGTGICGLARKLLGTPLGKGQGELAIMLSHTHLDHIQGFPFFIPVFIPGNKIRVFGGHNPNKSLRDILDGQVLAPYSPIYSLSNFAANLDIQELEPSTQLQLDGVLVHHKELPHKAMPSIGYRIEEGGKSLVYMTDIEYEGGVISDAALELAKEANILIHDTQYGPEDYESSKHEGHSSITSAIELAEKANAKNLVMFHYAPDYNDAKIKSLYDRFK